MTKIEPTDLEQIEQFKRLDTQLRYGIAELEKKLSLLAILDVPEFAEPLNAGKTPEDIRREIGLLLKSMRGSSVQFVQQLKDISVRARGASEARVPAGDTGTVPEPQGRNGTPAAAPQRRPAKAPEKAAAPGVPPVEVVFEDTVKE